MSSKNVHIALDFDRSLAFYYGGKDAIKSVGAPIPAMVDKVKKWLDKGYKISIFTARVAPVGKYGPRSDSFIREQEDMIRAFLKNSGLPEFEITAIKHPSFTYFVDDKAVGISENQGEFLLSFPKELE